MYHSDLDFYQTQTRATAMYPGVGSGDQMALAYLGLGLGEAGEVQGKIKKVIRDDYGKVTPEKMSAICAELGDVLWYVARIADELHIPLSEIADDNLRKLKSRHERGVITGSGDNR
jgi:NTP pyrophosphatase (non-canonical NTP hydrolase)